MRAAIGQYDIKHELGSGAFGVVYAAVDAELGRWVAIKELRREISGNAALVERFRAEAISLAKLNHPNITALYHLVHEDDEWFLVMELIQGQPLDKILYRLRNLELQETVAIIAQTAAGLGYANRMGVIHRDIKPSNLMLTDTGQVKIMDFGIARIQGTQRLTKAGLLGTYAYLAPEQFRGGEGTERSDLYALGCVAYEMLSGNIPFDAQTEAEMMHGHLELPPRPLRETLPGLDPVVDQAIQRALAKDPAARFANVEEFSDALGGAAIERQAAEILRATVLARMPPPPRPTTLTELPPLRTSRRSSSGGSGSATNGKTADRSGGAGSAWSSRLPAIVLGGAVTGVVVVGAAIMFLGQSSTSPPATATVDDSTASNQEAFRPALNTTPLTHQPGSANNQVASINNQLPPANDLAQPQHGGNFVPKAEHDNANTFLGGGEGASTNDLIREAQQLTAKGDILNARVKYLRAAQDDPQAYVELAHLYDPTEPNRPTTTAADPGLAALYYRDAEKMNDTTAHADRERLRQYLQNLWDQQRDYDAKNWLSRYWP